MLTNPHLEYELLAKEIYEILHRSEGVENIDVKHNVKVMGRSGCEHQIDVFWEFKMVGQVYRVAIECKNYSKEVSIGRIRDFFGVIHDIGDIKGIFITKEGYQSGAKKFGEYYNISLQEMREPNDNDWEGRIRKIVINTNVISPVFKKTNLGVNKEWHEKKSKNVDLDKKQFLADSDSAILTDENGAFITNVTQLFNQVPVLMGEDFNKADISELINRSHTFDYDNAYMMINGSKEKIDSVTFTYDITKESIVSEAEFFAKAILKDVKSGDIKFFDHDGGVK